MKNDKAMMIGGAMEGLRLPGYTSGKKGLAITPDQNLVLNNELVAFIGDIRSLYPFTTHTFTDARNGVESNSLASSAQFRAAYASAGFLKSEDFYALSNGKQQLTVPETGWYSIELIGAGTTAGRGGIVRAEVLLQKGLFLQITVGSRGSRACGAGATAVAFCTTRFIASRTLSFVAGGAAGGASGTNSLANAIVNLGSAGNGDSGTSFLDGNNVAVGGSGFSANGKAAGPSAVVPTAVVTSTGRGGSGGNQAGFGGYGGGGQATFTSGRTHSGGGGGYTGGGANYGVGNTPVAYGRGGTCFAPAAGATVRSVSSALTTAYNQAGSFTLTFLTPVED